MTERASYETNPSLTIISQMIFMSRWLQAPLYLGLIVAQGVYVYHFMVELWHLVGKATSIGEEEIMLIVLGLIDVVMIANLLIMVIIGGYETFVSRLNIREHPDQPEWLSHVNAATMKIKLAMALIGISSIHLLKTFINADKMEYDTIMWQVAIHLTFLLSAIAMAYTDRIMTKTLLDAQGKAEH
ncbi:MAG: TIGR00645 family protein [Gammaproteobacteria bacterium]|nr:TIGR00645 family protein [Gammaproteobacteria bacterium]